jgi:hypothetical protein
MFPKIRDKCFLDGTVDQTNCEITEKIDGSQISWRKKNGELSIYSKNYQIYPSLKPVQKTFKPAVTYLLSICDKIAVGYIYYGETLATPRHNVIRYSRIPNNNLVLWAVNDLPLNKWLNQFELKHEAKSLSIEYLIPLNTEEDPVNESCLGGVIEGVVYSYLINNSRDIIKFKKVNEAFYEIRQQSKENKNLLRGAQTDTWGEFKNRFKTEARWNKAIQHLRDQGVLENKESDIGLLCKETMCDILLEEEKTIQDFFNKTFRKELLKHAITGLADYYKNYLIENKS